MSEFRFANPDWVHGNWGVLLVAAVVVILELRARSLLDRLLSRTMQGRLVHRTSTLRRVAAIILATAAMVLLVFALMRPQWGRTVERSVRIDSQIMVCLDVSKSMLAEDVAPSRLERAKVELDSLLGLMDDGQQVGLTAFAGKATVLCPMTTDFGFLRLVLSEAEPGSVGRGGTQIGEAINKAVDGFRMAGDIQRMILLITDGEDHASYPLKAAERAREKGIRIVSIGFGDEAGSKIEITDPETGRRSFLQDRQGNDVISRLDGETLREIALKTSGAYVPAGTGALDLQSIYEKHIATLLRGSLEAEKRVIRHEAYQWFVLAAAVLLVMALASAVTWNLPRRALMQLDSISSHATSQTAGAVLFAVLSLVSFASSSALAQRVPPAPPASEKPASTKPSSTDRAETRPTHSAAESAKQARALAAESAEPVESDLPARVAYNRGVALIRTNPERAAEYLTHARSEAGSDGELRFRTLYNLGWVEVAKADGRLEEDPQQALQQLHQAANRFREAIRVRPDDNQARQNLEIVSRRILVLTDALRRQNSADLATRLDELIEQTRRQQGELQRLLREIAAAGEPEVVEPFRADFRRLGVKQRELISKTRRLTEDAQSELDSLEQKPQDEKEPAERVRTVQLNNLLRFADEAIQRMNAGRSRTRRLQAEGAFRRWSASLSALKRARDQLRNPVEILAPLIADAGQMAQFTKLLAANKLSLPGNTQTPAVPAWLSNDYVADLLQSITERTAELHSVFARVGGEAASGNKLSLQSSGRSAADPRAERLVENMTKAAPMIARARGRLREAAEELEQDQLDLASQQQRRALAELNRAAEQFFDIRRLIEVMYQHQRLARQVLQRYREGPVVDPMNLSTVQQTLERNLRRGNRLEELFRLERSEISRRPGAAAGAASPPSKAAAGPAGSPSSKKTPPRSQAERQQQLRRLELADELLVEFRVAAGKTQEYLKRADNVSVEGANESAEQAATGRQLELSGKPPVERTEGKVAGQRQKSAEQQEENASSGSEPSDVVPPAAAEPDQPQSETGEATLNPSTQDSYEDANSRASVPKPAATAAEERPKRTQANRTQATASTAAKSSSSNKQSGMLADADGQMQRSLQALEELRRLFFSLAEHLRDTARQQAELNDKTVEVAGTAEPEERPEKAPPLALEQKDLGNRATQIAEALNRQAEQARAAAEPQGSAPKAPKKPEATTTAQPDPAATAERLSKAVELVEQAIDSMEAANEGLNATAREQKTSEPVFENARKSQDEALELLLEALAELNENQSQQRQPRNQQQQQPQKKDGSSGKKPEVSKQKQQQQRLNSQQLLQMIRDMEAKRRESQRRRVESSGVAPDKDW